MGKMSELNGTEKVMLLGVAVFGFIVLSASFSAAESVIKPTVVVIDSSGVEHIIETGTILSPMAVSVGGVDNPEWVGINWNIRVNTDKDADVTVYFKSTQGEFGSKPYWDISADPRPEFAEFRNSDGYWTQTICSNTNEKLYVCGVDGWGWFLSFPVDGVSGAAKLDGLLDGEPAGTYICNWRVYGYAESGGLRDDFDITVPITVTKTIDGISTLSVVLSPDAITLH